MSYQVHYFLGISIPLDVAAELSKWAKKNSDKLPFQKWVVPEDYHITLIFLGAVADDQLAGIARSVPEIVKSSGSFPLHIEKVGFFGLPEQPRVFWAGIRHSKELSLLQRKIVEAAVPFGYVPEKRPYRPHITMARKWKGEQNIDVPPLPQLTMEAKVKEVILYRSHMNRTPNYEAMHRFSLT